MLELSPYQLAALDLLEQSKNARDQQTTRAAKASFDHTQEVETRLQAGATYQGLAYEEALALGNLMAGISRKRRSESKSGIKLTVSEAPTEANRYFPELKYVNIKTPLLLSTAPEVVEDEDIAHGYRFSTQARDQYDYGIPYFTVKQIRKRSVIKRHVLNVVMDEVAINTGTSDIATISSTGFKLMQFVHAAKPIIMRPIPESVDPESQTYLDQLVLLRSARIELGDMRLTP